MNLKKIKESLSRFADVFEENVLTDQEFLIVMGNILRQYALALMPKDERLKDVDIDDAQSISLAAAQYPDSLVLVILLQSHVLVKLSERFVDE